MALIQIGAIREEQVAGCHTQHTDPGGRFPHIISSADRWTRPRKKPVVLFLSEPGAGIVELLVVMRVGRTRHAVATPSMTMTAGRGDEGPLQAEGSQPMD